MASIAPKAEIIDSVMDTIKSYVQMALPSELQKSNIEVTKLDKGELKDIKARLSKRRELRTKPLNERE